ncbi:hypothetical protein BST81_23435 [Leptolyngbya sp. 'hensonii']|uniref:hypothetical protein n=1 Tax=Leptolyngbya sp. 'hensonii' TaxID=1922337 RepID=UPI00094FCFA1|nr:hypothetical protein [Leptolyngbya sp. 'hensonii']OLP16014.1 hypothetical protein BST81_23435 [Leptolyngbya sp. 'hensonii']
MALSSDASIWITGPTDSGKTTRLVRQFCTWVQNPTASQAAFDRSPLITGNPPTPRRSELQILAAGMLVFAATGDNRLDLTDRIATATAGDCPVASKTPAGFFEDEVTLFWPLLVQQLNLTAQFPIRLHPETEQELATRLWHPTLEQGLLKQANLGESRLVRQFLDLLQLAALSGTPLEDIPPLLQMGLPTLDLPWEEVGQLLLQWRSWCLERGLLTYGITTELYGRYLLSHPTYQQHLTRRYWAVLADDVDNYPAIARHLFEILMDQGTISAFTENPDGAVRLGLGGDPDYLRNLRTRCQVETLDPPRDRTGAQVGPIAVQLVTDPLFLAQLPDFVQAIQRTSRAQILRRTAEVILAGIQTGQIQPQEIAVIAPGLDAIARYTLTNILGSQGISTLTLNDQYPLASSVLVRALLTLLTLIYPGLGRLVDRDAVTEMLVVLSQRFSPEAVSRITDPQPGATTESPDPDTSPILTRDGQIFPTIDFVRASLIADHCFAPHPEHPRLLPATAFPRWDRLGYQATTVYEDILHWLEDQKHQLEQRLIPSPIAILDRAIQRFLGGGSFLPYDQLASLRELIESAQHYWEVHARLRQRDGQTFSDGNITRPWVKVPNYETVGQFIELLRSGAITANPFPVRSPGLVDRAVTLSSVFQYRSNRSHHRWIFLLDAGSSRWLSGSDVLFGAPLFLHQRSGRTLTELDIQTEYEQRLRRILLDLFTRAEERVFLCYSDLAVSGQEQVGPLLALVNAAVPYGETIGAVES